MSSFCSPQLLDVISGTVQFDKTTTALGTVVAKIYANDGSQINDVYTLKYDQEIWISMGEEFRDPNGKTLLRLIIYFIPCQVWFYCHCVLYYFSGVYSTGTSGVVSEVKSACIKKIITDPERECNFALMPTLVIYILLFIKLYPFKKHWSYYPSNEWIVCLCI